MLEGMSALTVEQVSVALFCTLATIPLSLWLFRTNTTNNKTNNNERDVPNAVGGAPLLLGNALQYKQDPPGCIREQERLTDSKVFRLNLAGRKLIVVGSDRETAKVVASQPESVLSSRRAVAEMGFEYTLGSYNVYQGTDWHKKILKSYIMGENFNGTFLPSYSMALRKSLEHEAAMQPTTSKNSDKGDDDDGFVRFPDLFLFVRRCILRAILDSLVSPIILKNDPELLTDLMAFQDSIEDATAKAAVLPRFVALPACLWPTQKARKVIERRISSLLSPILANKINDGDNKHNDEPSGPWIKTYIDEKTTPECAAEHLIGLIFAGHKNPSIGAAQSMCFLQELTAEQQLQATTEARLLCDRMVSSTDENSSLVEALLKAKTLRRCVLETTRLTAHTLGALRYAEKPLELHVAATSTPSKKCHLTIQQGETVALAHHTTHMETSLWGGNAAQFSIDRVEWKDDNARLGLAVPVDQYKYTSFSNGTHKCPGERVALAMMEMMLALLLERECHFVGDLPPVSFERATLAQRDGPCAFCMKQKI